MAVRCHLILVIVLVALAVDAERTDWSEHLAAAGAEPNFVVGEPGLQGAACIQVSIECALTCYQRGVVGGIGGGLNRGELGIASRLNEYGVWRIHRYPSCF
jgi:hypothetical protein